MQVNISLAAFPGKRHEAAAEMAILPAVHGHLVEPWFGAVAANHVQLVPQCFGTLTIDRALSLKETHPGTQFRLHANVMVVPKHTIAEVSGFDLHREWFEQAARVSQALNAPAYTAHSGSRSEATVAQMIDNARRIADLFECPVGIEGQYPTKGDGLLVSTWAEYQEVFESGAHYAIDLSHLNILAHKSGVFEVNLVKEMLMSDKCIEVHVSDNDGSGDWHQVCDKQTWWMDLLPFIHADSVVFTEGNHLRKKNA
jgi:hypothetical protein